MPAEPTQRVPDAEGHVIHMWQPFSFTVGDDYRYRPGPLARLSRGLFRCFAVVILRVLDTLMLGLKIDGRENLKSLEGGGVTICNHVHPLDCTMIGLALFPRELYYVSLASNFKIPVIRHLIRWLGAVPVTKSPHQIGRLFDEMGKAMAEGALVQIYPEGVLIPYDTALRPFKGGAFRLAADNGVSVVPMVITQEPPRGLFFWKRKPCLHLHILPAVTPDPTLPQREAANDLRQRCLDAMQARLNQEKA
ncbi:MAG: lysophospholipid acyltransferase family protein [Firmicutes bacterium]|nr:lysophospholipid acyltransferase family protein [Bacillota bacterium]